jgi:large subunit ribosomal protein L24
MRHVLKNDTVEVMAGDDRGKTGRVLQVIPEKGRVLVEHVNMVKRHTKPRSQNQKGGIIEKEAPIHWSNVLPVCSHCKRGVRVGYRTARDGHKERVCKGCGHAIERAVAVSS